MSSHEDERRNSKKQRLSFFNQQLINSSQAILSFLRSDKTEKNQSAHTDTTESWRDNKLGELRTEAINRRRSSVFGPRSRVSSQSHTTTTTLSRRSSVFSIDQEVYSSLFNEVSDGTESLKTSDTRKMSVNTLTNPSEDSCIICLAGPQEKNELIKLPCSGDCKNYVVHLLCIFRWKTKSTCDYGTCPLCRSQLQPINYTPPDILRLESIRESFIKRTEFSITPINKSLGMLKGYVKVYYKMGGVFSKASQSLRFEFYLQNQSGTQFNDYPNGPIPNNDSPAFKDILIMTAYRLGGAKQRTLPICVASNLDLRAGVNWEKKLDQKPIGFLKPTGLLGLQFNLFFRSTRMGNYHESLFLKFAQNRTGEHKGPRKMRIAFIAPKRVSSNEEEEMEVDVDDTASTKSIDSIGNIRWKYEAISSACSTPLKYLVETKMKTKSIFSEAAFDDVDMVDPLQPKGQLIIGKNKAPVYMSDIGGYSLDFEGRVSLPSNKNFQIVLGNLDRNREEVRLQFGKVDSDTLCSTYTLDFGYPFSPIQAFSIALSSCNWKLGCG